MNKNFAKFITALLSVFVCFHLTSCSSPSGGFIDSSQAIIESPTESVVTEEKVNEYKVVEEILDQDTISELTTREIYLRELYAVETVTSELLLQEEKIEKVLMTTSIYVPENHIEDFSENSQTSQLFNKVDLKPVLTKIAIGTGVILTLTVLKMAHLEGLVGSIVIAAADEALNSALVGMGVGTLVGGLVGASEGIDSSGRVAAVVGFSLAVVGVILSAVSLIAAIPSGGATAPAALTGVKIALAGIGLVAGLTSVGISTANIVKSFTATNGEDIDWNNIDWNKVGEGAAIKSIQGAANGYLWGSVIGAIQGGAKGLDFYNQFGAPYSLYNERLVHTPSAGGHWTGQRGESDFVLDEPITLKDGTIVNKITYHNAIPDFSGFAKAQVNISNMTDKRSLNFKQADELLAKYWSKIKYNGKTWTPRDISNYRKDNGLTWHELNNLKTMQLVPTEINSTWKHLGGVGEFNLSPGATGGSNFD